MPDAPQFDVDRLLTIGRVSHVAAAPCGTWLAVSVARLDKSGAKYVSDLWRVSLADDDASPIQLTRGEANDSSPQFRRDGALAFLRRGGGDGDGDKDRTQVWLLLSVGGEAFALTDEPLGVESFRFAKDADRLVVVASVSADVAHEDQRQAMADRNEHGPSALHYHAMPVRFWNHWLGPADPHFVAYNETGEHRRDLTPDARFEYLETDWDLSADGTTVATTSHVLGKDNIDNVALDFIDTASGKTKTLGGDEGLSLYSPLFDHTGDRLVCLREQRSPKGLPNHLWLFDLKTGDGQGHRVGQNLDAMLAPMAFSSDDQSVFALADYQGAVPVFRVDLASNEVTRITAESARGTHAAVSLVPSKNLLVGVRHTFFQPPEPFVVGLEAAATPRILGCLSGYREEQARAIAQVEDFSVPGDGGDPVQSFLMEPTGAVTNRPLFFWPHGGPIGQSGDGWHWRWNPLIPVAAGYAVVQPNPRGSTGFGQAFTDGVFGNTWGAACYRDLMAVVDHLAARDSIDEKRMVCMGGSFGGYMSNWIGGQTDRFSCIVTHASLYNLTMSYCTSDVPGWWRLEFANNDPYQNGEEFERYSPHRFVKNWRTPTLVIHGERDYRVPISDGLALFQALQQHGVDSELLVFPDEDHWIQKPRNIRAWHQAYLNFAAKHLA